jgi:hypothetical protein
LHESVQPYPAAAHVDVGAVEVVGTAEVVRTAELVIVEDFVVVVRDFVVVVVCCVVLAREVPAREAIRRGA